LKSGVGEGQRRSVGRIVRNEKVLHRVKEDRNILHTIKRRKAKWIGHILRRNCLLKHVIEGNVEGRIEVTGIQGRRSKQLLVKLSETRAYWKLKEEALDRTVWKTRFGSRKPDYGMNGICKIHFSNRLATYLGYCFPMYSARNLAYVTANLLLI
jgi:hypothetical protein